MGWGPVPLFLCIPSIYGEHSPYSYDNLSYQKCKYFFEFFLPRPTYNIEVGIVRKSDPTMISGFTEDHQERTR